jgi:DedD protein
MEKKKLLLVAISVGIFLVLTIGAAILVFTPKNAAPVMAAVSHSNPENITFAPPDLVDAVDLVRSPNDVPGLKALPEGTAIEGDNFYINVPKPSTAAVPDTAPAGKAAVPVTTPVRKTTAPDTAPAGKAAAPAGKVAVPDKAPAGKTAVSEKAPAGKPASQPANTANNTSTVSTVSQPVRQVAKPAASPGSTVQTKVYNDYWVQTGAFSTIIKAEGVKKTLASKGITSIIENGEIDGRTLFRVRVGPYTSHTEANYWLSLIKSINGFEDSQIRQTQSRR